MVIIITIIAGILFVVGVILKPKRSKGEQEITPKPISTFSSNDKKDILLKRFEESFKEIRQIQDFYWKGITIAATAVSALIGSIEILKLNFTLKLPFTFLAFIFILIGLFMLIRDREPFLEHLVILSRIESLLGLHERYDQFIDKRLVPDHYEKGANITFEEYIKLNKWKIKSLFFGFFSLYILLAFIVTSWIIASYFVSLPLI
jgi:hypothetical protein